LLIPDYVETYFSHPQANVISKENGFELFSHLFIGDIMTMNLNKLGFEYLNFLVFGVVGSGKSSFLNSVLTCFSSEIVSKAAVGGTTDHVTSNITRYQLGQLPGLEHVKINFYDIWGLDPNNYEHGFMLKVLNGQLPENYNMLERIAFRGERSVQWSTDEKRIHGVLFFVPINVLDDDSMVRRVAENIKLCVVNYQLNPILIVTRSRQVGNQLAKKKKEISSRFVINEKQHLYDGQLYL